MKRLIAGMAAALLAAVLFFPVKAHAVSAQSYILIDGTTGAVLDQCCSDKRSLIASTTKIMTALVVCEQTNVLDRVRIPVEAVGIEGSSMYLQSGEVLTVQELLYGLMLRSGNDAAVALAIYTGGTVEGFAQLMNDKAHRLGLENTHFVNPHGLDAPDHYSTAADLAKLTAYAMNNPIFAKTVSTRTVTIGNRVLQNHNKLLWQLEGADGVKTGYTKASGRILVSSVVRNDRRQICVTINAPDDWNDHKTLHENGFESFQMTRLLEKGQCVGTVFVAGGQGECVSLVVAQDVYYPLRDGEIPELILPVPGFVYAPVVAGGSAGYGNICLKGTLLKRVELFYADTVEMENSSAPFSWRSLWKGRTS